MIVAIGVLFLFCFGACIGSFLHLTAERYGTNSGILGASKANQSHCPYCKKALGVWELIPIFSYIFSRAQCSRCKIEIPVHYPIIELLTGLLAVVFFVPAIIDQAGFYHAVLAFLFACTLIILLRIDARLMLLPDTYIYLLTVLTVVSALLAHADFENIVFGILAGSGALYFLWAGTLGKGIGFGDVKLMIPLGIFFGFQGVVTLLFLSFFAGGALGIFLLASRLVTPKTAIPFGPFLAGSALFLMVFPSSIDRFITILGV